MPFDPAAGRYVAHWTDNFGAQYSTIGYGKRSGDAVELAFQYPEADTSPTSAKTATTCSSPRQHELDFWLGEWEVRDAGPLVTTSRIERTARTAPASFAR